MGRIGITQEEVENAVLQLQGRGKNPTVDAIRELLGTGSKSTIIQHLKSIKSKIEVLPSSLPGELSALVQGLWERLNQAADFRVIEAQNQYQDKLLTLQETLNNEQKAHNLLSNEYSSLKISFEQLHELQQKTAGELQETTQTFAQTQLTLHMAQQQIEEQKTENARLHQLANNIQANLEHYQAAIQKAREEQILQIENIQTKFQHEILEYKRSLQLAEQKNNDYQQKCAENSMTIQQLTSHTENLKQQLEAHQQQHQATQHDLIKFKERFEQTSMQLETTKNDLLNINNQWIEQKTKNTIHMENLDALHHQIQQLNDKNEHLTHENIFLKHEADQLRTAIKKLNKEPA